MFNTFKSNTTPYTFCFNEQELELIKDGNDEYILDKVNNQKFPIERFMRNTDDNYVIFIIKKKPYQK
jgi:hypothetical protein